jgi:flagellar hook-basal body complex protein FliE
MSIDPIGAIGSGFSPVSQLGQLGQVNQLSQVTQVTGPETATGTSGVDFGSLISGGLEHVQALQTRSDNLSVEAATGRLQDVHDYMIAANEAGLAVQLTVALRNRAVEAFNEIMRLQA